MTTIRKKYPDRPINNYSKPHKKAIEYSKLINSTNQIKIVGVDMCNFADSYPYTSWLWTTVVPVIPREIKLIKRATTYRLLYLISGELEMVIANQSHTMRSGDVCFLAPGTQYITTPLSAVTVANLYFTFDKELSKQYVLDEQKSSPNTIAQMHFDDAENFNAAGVFKSAVLSKIMKRILNEDTAQSPFYRQQIDLMVKQLLIEIVRLRDATKQNSELSPTMLKILQYIDDNITDPITVAQIAQFFSYHPVYINSLFKRSLGQTAHAYITRRRIDSVEKTLRFTDMSITEVAQAYSFSDCSHLSRVFRKVTGFSPTMIRQEANKADM